MIYLLVIPMVIASTAEALLWKKNKRGPLEAAGGSALWGLVLSAVVFAVTVFIGQDVFANITWQNIGLIVAVNVFTIICVGSWVMVLRNMPISIASPISLVRLVFLVFFSWLIFGGDLSIWQILVVGLIFIVCAMLGYFSERTPASTPGLAHNEPDAKLTNRAHDVGGERREHIAKTLGVTEGLMWKQIGGNRVDETSFRRGLTFMAIWIVSLIGLEMCATAVIRSDVLPTTYVMLRFGIFFLMALFLLLLFKRRETVDILLDKYLIGIGILWATASTFFNILLQTMNAGIVSAINTASVPLVILGGVIFFREKIRNLSYIFIFLILALTIGLSLLSAS
ncbi:MAG: EamA family transporter [Firmicutes bacterium]|nr:EamA family transporter [Bacillota bacterium]